MNNVEKDIARFRELASLTKEVVQISEKDKYSGDKVVAEIRELCKNLQYELSKVL